MSQERGMRTWVPDQVYGMIGWAIGRKRTGGRTFDGVERIEGIVTSTGGGHGPNPCLILFLRPWRRVAGAAEGTELRIEVPVKSERSLGRQMSTWDGAAVALSVRTAGAARGNFLERIVAESPCAASWPGRSSRR